MSTNGPDYHRLPEPPDWWDGEVPTQAELDLLLTQLDRDEYRAPAPLPLDAQLAIRWHCEQADAESWPVRVVVRCGSEDGSCRGLVADVAQTPESGPLVRGLVATPMVAETVSEVRGRHDGRLSPTGTLVADLPAGRWTHPPMVVVCARQHAWRLDTGQLRPHYERAIRDDRRREVHASDVGAPMMGATDDEAPPVAKPPAP